MVTYMKCIVLKTNQDIESHNITSISPTHITITDIKDFELNQGTGDFQVLNKWNILRSDIYIYGWSDGVHYQVNKTELPPPLDSGLYFGDLLIVKLEDGKWVDLDIDGYMEIYDTLFGGFEALGDDDSYSEADSDESDLSFVVGDDDSVGGESDHPSDEEDSAQSLSGDNTDDDIGSYHSSDPEIVEEA